MSPDDETTNDALPNDPMGEAKEDEVATRRANADSLRRQLDSLKRGRVPRSLNEFVDQKMAEDKRQDRSSD